MAWQRTIPFGYTMENGEILCDPAESKAVADIFKLCCEGDAYSTIADEMMRRGILYHKHTSQWNKNMIKRILENERYLGEKEYPAIITAEDFMNAQLCKSGKQIYSASPDYIQPIRDKAVCGICGAKMLRDTRSKGKARWLCENRECCNRHYIEDAVTHRMLTELLLTLAHEPLLLNWSMPQHTSDLTLEAMRIQNEITRELNRAEPSAEYTKMLMLACAAEKYSNLPDRIPQYRMEQMADRLQNEPIDEPLCNDLFIAIVKKIIFHADGKLSLRLNNDKIHEFIGKES